MHGLGMALGRMILMIALLPAAGGESRTIPPGGDAVFLFAYRAKPGQDAAFAEGYRRHLAWHAAHADSLPWLAWTVFDGPGAGTFIDGTFGIPFAAYDARVDPRGDAADADQNFGSLADPLYRAVYRLRRELGSATLLEDGRPTRFQKVVTVTVRPGREAAFEQALRTFRARSGSVLDYAVYEGISGGEQSAYRIIVSFAAWSDIESPAKDPSRQMLRAAGDAITEASSEIWVLRPELVYLPKR